MLAYRKGGTMSDIDFGTLDPQSTVVMPEEGSYHVLLRGEAGKGQHPWPYPPEVLQRRNNTTHAELAITIRLKPELAANLPEKRLDSLGPGITLHDALKKARVVKPSIGRPSLSHRDFELILIKMLRPAAPQGVEWNAPGGVVELKEDPTEGMLREFSEEAHGMRVLGHHCLFPFVQFSSGVYRESYGISLVFAHGNPKINRDEGALEWKAVPLNRADWIYEEATNQEDPLFCAVDGKIVMALPLVRSSLDILGSV